MMNMDFQYQHLIHRLKTRFSGASCGIFTNHSSFSWHGKKYLVSQIGKLLRLEKVFIPEHGFFAELQDQVPVTRADHYDFLETGAEICSLYPGEGSMLESSLNQMGELDLLIIDLQETGARYFTYVTMIAMIFEILKERKLSILLVDRPNPAGRMVEGTLLPAAYTSMIGWKGLPHRYGLTIGELAFFLKDQVRGQFELEV
ncbi:MAG: DUF1343 domain-containing protein, partial [Cyclobacteriaceae bacterium]|nr:DUF1343 domain-containing protein [Cyclobacteriaceae bacterium]